MYKISIILPVYNVEDKLEDAFKSILNQSFGFENIEVLFVDDCSSDSSRNIIKKLSDKYANVKSIFLDENSGFAGKPRNVGIENASADYLMFLDPDDEFLENACDLLYDNIVDSHFDIVSANYIVTHDDKIENVDWSFLDLTNGSIEINNISQQPELLKCNPSVWAKIFKKEFILKNNITFPVGVPAQDLVFVYNCLLNANGIKFINIPIVKYLLNVNEGQSTTSTRNKRVLYGYIKAFTLAYNLFTNYEEYSHFALNHLHFWSMQFSLSQLPLNDKIDLLRCAQPLFAKFHNNDNIEPSPLFKKFFKSVYKKDYLTAIDLSQRLSLNFIENNANLMSQIKNRDILLLFFGCDIEIGGLEKIVCDRANLFYENGYSVKLLNIDDLKDFENIIQNYYDNGYLNKSIEVINIFDYYSKKNNSYEKANQQIPLNDNLITTEEIQADGSKVIRYFDCLNDLENNDKQLVKEEMYISDYLACLKKFENNNLLYEKYYTKDGFNYLIIDENKKITLNDRFNYGSIVFKNIYEFRDYFVTELCLMSDEKPFLISDCSAHFPSIKNISSSVAYKIGNAHSNPYNEEPYCFGCNMRNIAAINDYKKQDKTVVLTETLKNDLIKQFNSDKFICIPNFINGKESFCENKFNEDNKVISIFARISPEKNLSDLIKAFKLVLDKHDDAVLKIFGRSLIPIEINEKTRLDSLIDELGIKDSVKFMGHTENVYGEMNNSLITCLVSDIEGFSLVLMESMINYTPVISYDTNYGPNTIIDDGVNGFLVKQYDIQSLADKICYALDNPKEMYDWGFKAHEKIISNFSPEIILSRWEELFLEIYKKDMELSFKKQDTNKILKKDIKRYKKQIKKCKKLNNELLSSTSWKITKPFRKIKNMIKFLK